ncbi:MAG: hypothetical protein K2R98_08410 [Gemmataceae bacterium]|nr:hypothetical protein [Gemmataceae bacterium]
MTITAWVATTLRDPVNTGTSIFGPVAITDGLATYNGQALPRGGELDGVALADMTVYVSPATSAIELERIRRMGFGEVKATLQGG